MKRTVLSFLVVFITLLFCVSDSSAQWHQTGQPYGGTIYSLINSGGTLFAGTNGGGVYFSTDDGQTWSQANSGLTNYNVGSLAASGSNIFAGTGANHVFLSTNGGGSWTDVSPGLTVNPSYNVHCLAASGSNVFAGSDAGIYVSTDNGGSWSSPGLPDTAISSLVISGTTVIAGTYNYGIFVSTDNGQNWSKSNTGLSDTNVFCLTSSGTNLFAGTWNGGGVFISTDNGGTWRQVSTGLSNSNVKCLCALDTMIFAGSENNGVYVSTNDGGSWSQANGGLTETNIYSFAVSDTDLFAGTYSTGIWRRPLSEMVPFNVNLTFSVNMADIEAAGGFDTHQNALVVRGDFEHYVNSSYADWSGDQFYLTKSATNDSIYSVSMRLSGMTSETEIQYKFVIIDTTNGQVSFSDQTDGNGEWESESAGPGPNGNRVYILSSDSVQTLPAVYFNNISGTLFTHQITFQADLSSLLASGFNPTADTMNLRGNWPPLHWGEDIAMSRDPSDTSLYRLTLSISMPVGATLEYKYHAVPEVLFQDSGWDTLSNNRTMTFPSSDTTLAAVEPAIYLIADVPLSAPATGLKAIASNGRVDLTWQTQSEVGNLGFNIIKKDVGTGESLTIASYKTDASLRGLGTSTEGRSYSYVDNHVSAGQTYDYTVQSVSVNGATKDYPPIEVKVELPKNYALYQNYPNPFNPTTTIAFDLKEASDVTLSVYNVLGQRVAEWDYGTMNAGSYDKQITMERFASGVYYYRIDASGNGGKRFVSVKKMMLMK